MTLEAWLRAVVETPGLTSLRDLDEARRVLLEDSLRGVEVVSRYDGPMVDVGSGGGAPGIPLAVARVADRLAARLVSGPSGLLVLRKEGPTPPGFPRRPGMARKRPLA